MTEVIQSTNQPLTKEQLLAVIDAGDQAVEQVSASGVLLTDGSRESVRQSAERAEFAEQLSIAGMTEAIDRLRAVSTF